jgi:hypothetical protein
MNRLTNKTMTIHGELEITGKKSNFALILGSFIDDYSTALVT